MEMFAMEGTLSAFLDRKDGRPLWAHSPEGTLPHMREGAMRLAVAADMEDVPAMCRELSEILLCISVLDHLCGFNFDVQASGMEAKIRRRMMPEEGSGDRFGSWKAGKVKEKGIVPSPDAISCELPSLMRLVKVFRQYPPRPCSLANFSESLRCGHFETAILFLSAWAFQEKMDPEHALRMTNDKFFRRLSAVEDALFKRGKSLGDSSLDEMMGLWRASKGQEHPHVFKQKNGHRFNEAGFPGFLGLSKLAEDLADPAKGDAWTLSQTPLSIALHAVEEGFEATDAYERGDMPLFDEELGDMIMQVVFMAENCLRRGFFGMREILEYSPAPTADHEAFGIFSGLPEGCSAIARSIRLQEVAVSHGFEWRDVAAVQDKVDEEILELEAEMAQGNTFLAQRELGDLMFAALKLARWQGGFDENSILSGLKEIL
ncbi:MAG: hypothetical protein A2018_04245 [Alphaproteobacteria bacterium GWF2_58_20]|nr:MAG: hypothetical protein A2018_04245 [Alphaproteobacteria bacterium GWF2_58_20]